MRTHFSYLKLLRHHAMLHADAGSAAMTVVTVVLLAVGVGGIVNAVAEKVPGGGIYTMAGFVGLYMVGKSVWNADQAAIASLRTDAMAARDAVALLETQSVTLNDHETNYAEVLRLVWQKLTQGATEAVVEYELDHAFPQPEG